ncbi:hypothetical protein V6N13_042729 [Hibiscus sabdariffa]
MGISEATTDGDTWNTELNEPGACSAWDSSWLGVISTRKMKGLPSVDRGHCIPLDQRLRSSCAKEKIGQSDRAIGFC